MPIFNELSTENTVLKNFRENLVQDQTSSKLFYQGIVVKIDKYGGSWTRLGRPTPPYTMKIYIPELDTATDVDHINFFEPLLPMHLNAIPEIKEEVLVIFDSTEKKNGYWIKRLDSSLITKSLPNRFMNENVDDSKRFGAQITENDADFDFKDSDEEPSEKNVPLYRKFSGDVIQEGRSNTLIRQSFSLGSKKGIIDIVTERKGEIAGGSQDLSKIKDREFQDSEGSRILLATKKNIDKNSDWDLTEKPQFKYKDQNQQANVEGDKNSHSEASYIFFQTDEFRFFSRKSKEKLNNAVLGNSQEKWLCSLMELIEQMMDIVAKDPSQQIVITQGVPNAVNLMAGGMQAAKQKLIQLKKEIYKHHSKNLFLN